MVYRALRFVIPTIPTLLHLLVIAVGEMTRGKTPGPPFASVNVLVY